MNATPQDKILFTASPLKKKQQQKQKEQA